MIGWTIIFILAFATLCEADTKVRSPEKLRSLVMLPTLELKLVINSQGIFESGIAESTNDFPRRIQALRRQMQNDPSDAERYQKIGNYLSALNLSEEATKAMSNAATFYRPRAEARPQDAPLQATYAAVLRRAGQQEEAERVLRATTRAVPTGWNCWVELGELLVDKALRVTWNTNGQRNEPTQGRREEVAKFLEESAKCYDRAVSVGAKQFEPYVYRALHRSLAVGLAQKGEMAVDTMGESEVCLDYARAARLAPTNVALVAYWAWSESLPTMMSSGETPPITVLPESRRKNVLEAMRILEQQSETGDTKKAARALELLGILQVMVTREIEEAQSSFRRAVTTDSTRDQAWEGLVLMALKGDPERLVSISEDRLKHSNTARNLVIAAKACDLAKMDERALKHARAAMKIDGQSPLVRSLLVALLVKRLPSEDKTEVRDLFKTLPDYVAKIKVKEEYIDLSLAGRINWCIGTALEGGVELAREPLRELIENKDVEQKYKDRCREILTILGD